MSFIDTVKAFLKTPKVDSVAIAVHDAFSDAGEAYDAAFHAIEPYTTRANHRLAIFSARSAFNKAPLDGPYADDAYDEAVAAYTDSADFDSYTEAYLDAHTAAIDSLTAALDSLTAAFADFEPTDDLYASATALYKSDCDIYRFAVAAYSNAAFCTMTTAMEGNIQAAKDDFQLMLLENGAANAADAVTAKAKAAAFKVKAIEGASKAKQLEQKARSAETKAEVFLSKAKSAEANAEKALETSR
jgi:hypothetical protein